MVQDESSHSQKPGYAQTSMVTTWMGDHFVLGFAPVPRFVQSDSVQTTNVLWVKLYFIEVPLYVQYMETDHIHMHDKCHIVHASIL